MARVQSLIQEMKAHVLCSKFSQNWKQTKTKKQTTPSQKRNSRSEKRRRCHLKTGSKMFWRARVSSLVSEWQAWAWLLRLTDGDGWSPLRLGPSCPNTWKKVRERGLVLATLAFWAERSIHSTKNIIFTPFWTFHFKIYLNSFFKRPNG